MRTHQSEGRIERLRFLRGSLGAGGMLRRLLHQIIAPLYRCESAYITLKCYIEDEHSTIEYDIQDQYGTECVAVTCLEELDDLSHEVLPPVNLQELEEHLESESNRTVILARRDNPNASGKRVIGFRKLIRGQFSHFHGSLTGKLPDDVLMDIGTYVIPECRGQGTHGLLRAMAHDYAYRNGVRRLVGAIMSHNIASLRASNKGNLWKAYNLGPIRTVSVLGGLFSKATPFDEILHMINDPEEANCNPLNADS